MTDVALVFNGQHIGLPHRGCQFESGMPLQPKGNSTVARWVTASGSTCRRCVEPRYHKTAI